MGKKQTWQTRRRLTAWLVTASMVASMLPFSALTASAATGVNDTLDPQPLYGQKPIDG